MWEEEGSAGKASELGAAMSEVTSLIFLVSYVKLLLCIHGWPGCKDTGLLKDLLRREVL